MHQHYVLRLDVPMQYLLTMHEVNGLQQVPNHKGSGLLTQRVASSNDIIELAVTAQLHYDVELLLIMEIPIDLDDVGVVQEGLDSQLSGEL